MTSVHASTIYYKGYAYEISSDGKAEKREMNQKEIEMYSVTEEPLKIEEQNIEVSETNNSDTKEDINNRVDEQGE